LLHKKSKVPVYTLKTCRSTAPLIVNPGSRWRWVVNFTCQLLYPWGKNLGTHVIGGLGGPKAGLDIFGKKYVLLLLWTAAPDGLITILTTPSWLPQQFIQHYKMTEENKPVITGVIGTISGSLRQYLSNITEKHKIKKLQKKTAISDMDTSVLSANVKVQNRFHRQNNIICSTNCKISISIYLAFIWSIWLWPVGYGTCQYRNKVTNIVHEINTLQLVTACII